MKKARWFVLAGVTLGLILYLYFSEGKGYTGSSVFGRMEYVFKKLYDVMSHLDVKFLLAAFFFQVLVIVESAFETHYVRSKYQKVSYFYSLHSNCFGKSIGALLPGFLSADAMSEIGIMKMQGLDIHKSGSMTLSKQIVYFITICYLPLIFILANFNYFKQNSFLLLNLLYCAGLFINILTIFFYAFIARANKALYRIASIIIRFFAKMKIVKNKEKLLNSTKNTLDSLKEQMLNLPLKWYDWIILIVCRSVSVIITNLVSYSSALALGIRINGTFGQMVASSGFVSAISVTLPVPSGIGIADVAYKNIMQPLVGVDRVNYLLLLWRIVTFYFPIMISVIVMAFPIPGKKLAKKSEVEQ